MMLEVTDLTVDFPACGGSSRAVDGVSFTMERGEIVGIVGESGSGKSVTARTILGLTDRRTAAVCGSVRFEGTELLTLPDRELRHYQGRDLSMIFQEPMTCLDPTMTIGKQVEEAMRLHTKLDRAARRKRALETMREAELPDPERLYGKYPHELSGGMRQRVMIAAALVLEPKLLLADEPTTALDVTIQAQILSLLRKINREDGTAILFISHDLGVVRKLCSRVLVMYHGRVVEEGDTESVFLHPREDYTKLLLASRPTRAKRRGGESCV